MTLPSLITSPPLNHPAFGDMNNITTLPVDCFTCVNMRNTLRTVHFSSVITSSLLIPAELRSVLTKKRGDDVDDDSGLPRSPATPPDGPLHTAKTPTGKSGGSCSDGSMLSIYSSGTGTGTDDDIFGPLSDNSSRVSLSRDQDSAEPRPPGVLSHAAAKHRIAVRPKRNHGASRPRRPAAAASLPATVEEEGAEQSPPAGKTEERNGGHAEQGAPAAGTERGRATLPAAGVAERATPVQRSRSTIADRRLRDLSPRKLWGRDTSEPAPEKKSEGGFFSRLFGSRRSGRKRKAGKETEETPRPQPRSDVSQEDKEKREAVVKAPEPEPARPPVSLESVRSAPPAEVASEPDVVDKPPENPVVKERKQSAAALAREMKEAGLLAARREEMARAEEDKTPVSPQEEEVRQEEQVQRSPEVTVRPRSILRTGSRSVSQGSEGAEQSEPAPKTPVDDEPRSLESIPDQETHAEVAPVDSNIEEQEQDDQEQSQEQEEHEESPPVLRRRRETPERTEEERSSPPRRSSGSQKLSWMEELRRSPPREASTGSGHELRKTYVKEARSSSSGGHALFPSQPTAAQRRRASALVFGGAEPAPPPDSGPRSLDSAMLLAADRTEPVELPRPAPAADPAVSAADSARIGEKSDQAAASPDGSSDRLSGTSSEVEVERGSSEVSEGRQSEEEVSRSVSSESVVEVKVEGSQESVEASRHSPVERTSSGEEDDGTPEFMRVHLHRVETPSSMTTQVVVPKPKPRESLSKPTGKAEEKDKAEVKLEKKVDVKKSEEPGIKKADAKPDHKFEGMTNDIPEVVLVEKHSPRQSRTSTQSDHEDSVGSTVKTESEAPASPKSHKAAPDVPARHVLSSVRTPESSRNSSLGRQSTQDSDDSEPVVLRRRPPPPAAAATSSSPDSELLKVFKRRSLKSVNSEESAPKLSTPTSPVEDPLRVSTEDKDSDRPKPAAETASVSPSEARSVWNQRSVSMPVGGPKSPTVREAGPPSIGPIPTETAPVRPERPERPRKPAPPTQPRPSPSAAVTDTPAVVAEAPRVKATPETPRSVSAASAAAGPSGEHRRSVQPEEGAPTADWLKLVRERREQREQREQQTMRKLGHKEIIIEPDTLAPARAPAPRSSRVLEMANTFQKLQPT
ncbi:hypothetical protein FJT64_026726 [Amphibalanus amphitrite]|uniref:Uncharacterized protein n=1 Tax=Amphibalanus amphitrite TaxID=1232801 RepID=A0A6A4WDH4_AMPAM|nr:hypothetical protein FJT64_026726 [Amphibalanus amphitrite]